MSARTLLACGTLLLAAGAGFLRGASVVPARVARNPGIAGSSAAGTASRTGTIDGLVDGIPIAVAEPAGDTALLFPLRLRADSRRALVRVRVPAGVAAPRIEAGDHVQIAGQIALPTRPGNPGEADRRQTLRRRGVVAHVFTTAGATRVSAPSSATVRDSIRRAGALFRRLLLRRLRAAVGEREEASAVSAALFLGERDGLPEALRDEFRAAGASHLLAVSGLHVVLLIGCVSAGLRGIADRVLPGARGRTLALASALVALAGYALACQLATSVVRASIFVVLAMTAHALGRRTTTTDHLAAAALVVLAADPAQALGAGFQLSFAAVAGLCLLTTPFREALFAETDLLARFPEALPRFHLRARLWLARGVSASLAASTATAPVTAAIFGELHPASVIANVLAIPIVGVLLPISGLGAVLGAPAEPLLGPLIGTLSTLLTAIVAGVAALPVATIHPGRLSPIVAGGALAILAIASQVRPWDRRHLIIPIAVWVGLALAPAPGRVALPGHAPAIVALDVGHGQAVLVVGGDGGTLLADAGGRLHGSAERVLLPALHALGITRLSVLALSHEDSDHCSAAPELLASMRVGVVLVPMGFGGDPAGRRVLETCVRQAVPVRFMARGDVFAIADLRVRVLHPPESRPGPADNGSSLVLHIEAGDEAGGAARNPRNRLAVLLPGDIEGATLEALVADATLPRADVLLLPHHGRGDSAPQLRLARRCAAAYLVASTSEAALTDVPGALQTGRVGALLFTAHDQPRLLRP